ncbi:MAG: sigma-70 family RNA polymerase sigma factor, partial [Pyrinomonadaceae bacterium]
MSRPPSDEASQLLSDWSNGDQSALERLLPLVSEELHRLAHHYMTRERAGHTLQTTALVNEAYIRLADQKETRWQNRAHFFAIAAQLMRRILIDHARTLHASKRGGGLDRVPLDDAIVLSPEPPVNLLDLDQALIRLHELDARKSQIVELRYFGGLTVEETAEVLKISAITV